MSLSSNSHALLVGINDYATYDRSVGNPTGTSNLRGALEDVGTWLRICRYFAIPGERIRVLTHPVLGEAARTALGSAAEGVEFGGATLAEVEAGVDWLASRMEAPGEPGGLIFLAGHADLSEAKENEGFCPSDTTGRVDGEAVILEGTFSLTSLKARLDAAGAGDRVTAFMDICHAPRRPGILERLSRRAARRGAEWPGFTSRLFASCRPDEESVEAVLDGRWQGVFTWAVRNVLLQWGRFQERGVVRSTLAQGRLIRGVDSVIEGLGYEQRSKLSGTHPLLPVLHPGVELHRGETSDHPDGRHRHRQLDGGAADGFRLYQFDLGLSTGTKPNAMPTLGLVLVANSNSPSGNYKADREYFRFDVNALNLMAAQGYTLWVADCSWETAEQLNSLHNVVTWTPGQCNAWAYEQPIASDTSPQSGPPVFASAEGGPMVAARFEFPQGTAGPAVVTWFDASGDYLFGDTAAADLRQVAGAPYRDRFTVENRVKFQTGPSVPSNYHALGSQNAPDAINYQP